MLSRAQLICTTLLALASCIVVSASTAKFDLTKRWRGDTRCLLLADLTNTKQPALYDFSLVWNDATKYFDGIVGWSWPSL
ncbi:uncharacterized protein L969DRAFT_84638 [Mixia osmundae IAM 14324]|uniref:uncharacterized protein n=1 Tax=Mixia osmundae (strain CBS 9802 / IAM 14324 / JCM 22182 / KY 12970) TaxID=764103 RepID=UPI0004A54AF7|nr:uncharacterized protein L969DRAFT_84638 [Mixia osmundae IAM 14324]KEI42758.1 hypothetical protein L969DRAFT_84638 [Mixia osmundae IAM 14324]